MGFQGCSSVLKLTELSIELSESVVLGLVEASQLGIMNCFCATNEARIAKSLAVASEGWPRHLHYYLQGLANALVADIRCEEPRKKGPGQSA